MSLSLEVLVLSQKQLEFNGRLIKEHTSNGGSKFFSVSLMDRLVNVITHKVISIITAQLFELSNIDLRKLHWRDLLLHWLLLLLLLLLLLHHGLLLRWLLTHLLLWRLLAHLLLTWVTLHTHLHVLVVLVSSSHLAIVIVLPSLVVVALVVALATARLLLKVATSSSVTTTTSMLVSLSTTIILVSIILEVSLSGSAIIPTLHSTGSTLIKSYAVLLLDLIYQLCDVVDVFISDSILSFVLCLPEIYFEWFHLICEEISHFIKELDCFLSLFDTLVENIANLILWRFESKLIDFIVFEFDGDDWTCLFKHLLNFFLGCSKWNELNV